MKASRERSDDRLSAGSHFGSLLGSPGPSGLTGTQNPLREQGVDPTAERDA